MFLFRLWRRDFRTYALKTEFIHKTLFWNLYYRKYSSSQYCVNENRLQTFILYEIVCINWLKAMKIWCSYLGKKYTKRKRCSEPLPWIFRPCYVLCTISKAVDRDSLSRVVVIQLVRKFPVGSRMPATGPYRKPDKFNYTPQLVSPTCILILS